MSLEKGSVEVWLPWEMISDERSKMLNVVE